MTCEVCRTEAPIGEQSKGWWHLCWCRIDLCANCIESHTKGCEWALAMDYKPLKKKARKKALPIIGAHARSQQRGSRYDVS